MTNLAFRPIDRAARAARVLTHDRHPVRVAGPAILHFDEEDFVAALGALVMREAWPERAWPRTIAARMLTRASSPQTLLQPVQRRFNLALVEASCDIVGTPRLDPAKIASAAIVVRRYVGPRQGSAMPASADLDDWRHWQGWFAREGTSLGWQPFASAGEFDADPDAALARAGWCARSARIRCMRYPPTCSARLDARCCSAWCR